MKKMGLIGGLSWVSTAEYYRRINEITREKRGSATSAWLILESVKRHEYVDVKTFSTTEIHCKAAVKMALEA